MSIHSTYHNMILCCKDKDMRHMILIFNHVCFEVNADSSKASGACKEKGK